MEYLNYKGDDKMKIGLKKAIIIFLISFSVLFTARLIYVFNSPNDNQIGFITGAMNRSNNLESAQFAGSMSKQNYATTRVIMKDVDANQVTIDQKYERIGFITSTTKNFDSDNTSIRNNIKADSAVIQFENNTGTKGKRILELSIGVHPEKFDSFVEKIKGIGTVIEFRITKNDKTSEYKNLMAQQTTLQSTKTSLTKLKENGGSIAELINLENRILEIEQQLQGFGVQLENYNEESELCTVKVTIKEKGADKMLVLRNVLNTTLWTTGCYALIILSIILTTLAIYLILIVVNKIRQMYLSSYKATSL